MSDDKVKSYNKDGVEVKIHTKEVVTRVFNLTLSEEEAMVLINILGGSQNDVSYSLWTRLYDAWNLSSS